MTDLRGKSREIVLEETVVADLVDHVGTLEVTLPGPVRFEVVMVTPYRKTETLAF